MSRSLAVRLVMVLVLVTGSLAGAAERLAPTSDWPQWRGPNRDGISTETGLLTEWKEPPALLWKKSGLGRGYASIAVVGDVLYTAGKVKEESLAYALNEADGSVKWSVPLGKAGDENPRATPTVDGERVYFLGAEGALGKMLLNLKQMVGRLIRSEDDRDDATGWWIGLRVRKDF